MGKRGQTRNGQAGWLRAARRDVEEYGKNGSHHDGQRNAIIARGEVVAGEDAGFLPRRAQRKPRRSPRLPGREVQATTAVVIITVFLFAGYFFVVDFGVGERFGRLMHWLARR